MKRLLFLLLFCSLIITLYAQDSLSVEPPVKRPWRLTRLDIGLGSNIDLTSRREENLVSRLSERTKVATAINLRFAYFPINRWGMYCSIYINLAGNKNKSILPEIYQRLEPDFFIREKYANHTTLNNPTSAVLLGPAYRIEQKKWGMYSRIGVGSNQMIIQEGILILKKKESNDLYTMMFGRSGYDPSSTVFGIELGINAYYKLNKQLHLFIDASYFQPFDQSKIEYSLTDLYTDKIIRSQTSTSSTLGRSLQFNIGVGIPIRINRGRSKHLPSRKERVRALMEKKRKDYGLFPGNK